MRTKPILAASVLTLSALGTLALAPHEHNHTGHAAGPAAQADASSLAFLAGRWVGSLGPNTVEELWTPPVHGNVTGCFRLFGPQGDLALLELTTITTDEEGQTSFAMRHFDAALSPWATEADGPFTASLVQNEPNKLTFKATASNAEVTTIVYDGTKEGAITVTLTFAESKGRDPLTISLQRAK